MINLVHNSLETLPDSFCQLQSLELCLLSRNCLQRLPENFGNLPFLNHLEVNDNKLLELPPTFKNLVKLTCLDLSNNRLMKEPNFLHVFTHLNYLNLHSNPFEFSVVDIVDPELSYAYVEDAGESPKSGQFEDLESDEVEELNLESKTPSNKQEGKEATVQIDPPANNLSQFEHHNVTKGNQISQSACQQKEEEEEEEETDCDLELSNGLYDVDTYSYQDRHFFMPSDIHCKNVRYNSVQFHFFPDTWNFASFCPLSLSLSLSLSERRICFSFFLMSSKNVEMENSVDPKETLVAFAPMKKLAHIKKKFSIEQVSTFFSNFLQRKIAKMKKIGSVVLLW
ncbi:unnamed protein product [Acanthosepion pharaonis]|uniref:Uncharacterized protein n=1 Tax=Acanthosepion pharaonis TaxID=158019 RepID=A0A812CPX9_ACAPH|nr:unnamed protein product [Sepia pharaonis]